MTFGARPTRGEDATNQNTITGLGRSGNVEREVTDPIEYAITGMSGLKDIQSTSSKNQSLVFASLEFGEDMEEVERTVEGNISGIQFPPEVADPLVRRVHSDEEPVLQLSVIGDRDIPALQRIADELIIPHIKQTVIALVPLAFFAGGGVSLIGAELATVVIGGLISSTFLTLIVVPVVYSILHVDLPGALILLRQSMQHRKLARQEAER